MTTQHAKPNAREGGGVADDLAVVQAILRDEEGWSGRERQALTAAIAAMQAQQGAEPVAWQPIDSVPRDGRQVVVWREDGTFSSARYDAHSEPYQVTHWMIPTAPATGAPR